MTAEGVSYNVFEESLHDMDNPTGTEYDREDTAESYTDSEHLSSEAYTSDTFSRTPSPLPPLHPSHENISFDHWNRRYDIHNDAMSELFSSLSNLSTNQDASYLRYALIPLIILGLVSRPGSIERALYFAQMGRFQQCMVRKSIAMPNPVGGSLPKVNIPWDQLDAYSRQMEQHQRDSAGFVFNGLRNAAPEWNWYHMLRHLNLTSICEWADTQLSPLSFPHALGTCSWHMLTSILRAYHCWNNSSGGRYRVLGFQCAFYLLHRRVLRCFHAASSHCT
jgi:hypothetical protein